MNKFCPLSCFLICCLAGITFTAFSACTRGPENFEMGQVQKLECDFKAPAREVYWYKSNKLFTNGTEGFYQSYDQLDEDTLRSTLHFPKVHAHHTGKYTCKADTSLNSECPNGTAIDVDVICGKGHIKAVDKLVYTEQFSNTSVRCSALSWSNCLLGPIILTWLYRNRTLQNSTKYTIKQHMYDECMGRLLQAEFILEINNVTPDDAGEYFCQMECKFFVSRTEEDSIELVTLRKPSDTTEKTTITLLSRRQTAPKWIVSIMCGSVFAITLAAVFILRKFKILRSGSYKIDRQEDVLNNKLFISYSSKDYSWVTENLIALLDKHSIPYSIHIRDFELGKPIVENMADSVYNSRQVLIVLSDNYLGSNFCREELRMAMQRGVDTGDSSLILVMIDKFKKSRLPCALRNKTLLDFEKLKRKQGWEKKLLSGIIDSKCLVETVP